MRLSPDLLESPLFQFSTIADLRLAAPSIPNEQIEEAERLIQLKLPPVVSVNMLATIFGLNSGIIWSFCHKPEEYYRTFNIKKGAGHRKITAPRVGLKVLQKWMGYHLSRADFPEHVYGFVPGRSHIDAALRHVGSEWSLSVDIANFFPSTPRAKIIESLISLSYSPQSAEIIANLNTLNGFLVQGSPASPPLSNIAFRGLDTALQSMAEHYNCKLTRYADDITFSGNGLLPDDLLNSVELVLAASPWQLNAQKTEVQPLKGRIKVHGLLIKEDTIRLTKGYRNKLRAYAHVLNKKGTQATGFACLSGHLNYANQISEAVGAPPIFNMTEIRAVEPYRAPGGLFSKMRSILGKLVVHR